MVCFLRWKGGAIGHPEAAIFKYLARKLNDLKCPRLAASPILQLQAYEIFLFWQGARATTPNTHPCECPQREGVAEVSVAAFFVWGRFVEDWLGGGSFGRARGCNLQSESLVKNRFGDFPLNRHGIRAYVRLRFQDCRRQLGLDVAFGAVLAVEVAATSVQEVRHMRVRGLWPLPDFAH